MIDGSLDGLYFIWRKRSEGIPETGRQDDASGLHFLFRKFLEIFIKVCGLSNFHARVSGSFHFFPTPKRYSRIYAFWYASNHFEAISAASSDNL